MPDYDDQGNKHLHAGDAQYLPSNAVDTIEIGKYSTSISGTGSTR